MGKRHVRYGLLADKMMENVTGSASGYRDKNAVREMEARHNQESGTHSHMDCVPAVKEHRIMSCIEVHTVHCSLQEVLGIPVPLAQDNRLKYRQHLVSSLTKSVIVPYGGCCG